MSKSKYIFICGMFTIVMPGSITIITSSHGATIGIRTAPKICAKFRLRCSESTPAILCG